MLWRILGVVLTGTCWLVAFGFWAFGMDLSALGWLAVGATALPIGWSRWRLVPFFLAALATAPLSVASVYEYGHRVEVLSAKLAGGPDAFSAREKLGIYGLNLAMGVTGAAVGFPEVAMETLLLTIPGGPVRNFESDFPMRSPKVRDAVAAMLVDSRPRTVAWAYSGQDSMRVALACNSLHLTGEPVVDDGRRGLRVSGRVQISYAERYFLVIGRIPGRTLGIEEGLFRMLERAGWLFPYDAVWTWTVWTPESQTSTE